MSTLLQYVPYVGDSKRAMDEYTSEIFMGGTNTIVLHNTCEDSLLAAPIILDLVLLAELSTRIQFKAEAEVGGVIKLINRSEFSRCSIIFICRVNLIILMAHICRVNFTHFTQWPPFSATSQRPLL